MCRTGAFSAIVGMMMLAAVTAKRARPAPSTKVIFQWLDMYECPELPEQNLTTVLRYTKSGDVFADTDWNVVHPAKKITILRQIMSKCREDGTQCEHFMTWNSPMDGCAFIAAKNAVWSPCFSNIEPPFVCPVEAVHYVNMNWTIDKDLSTLLPFPRHHVFKDRLEMWNEKNELTYCIILEFIWKNVKPRKD